MQISSLIIRRLRPIKWKIDSVIISLKDRYRQHRLGLSEANKFLDISKLSRVQLLSLGRNEAHRLEKAFYNGGITNIAKMDYYVASHQKLGRIINMLKKVHNVEDGHPVLVWMTAIYKSYPNVGDGFIKPRLLPAAAFDSSGADKVLEHYASRRSVRVWAVEQPTQGELRKVAEQMVEAVRFAPSSSNRQAWRFSIIEDEVDKQLLQGIKEPHCINAPLLIFMGIDRTVYGAMGKNEKSIWIDGGAAVMQMIQFAHSCGMGTCWNHFASDLIYSRKGNPQRYRRFAKHIGITSDIEPIAILSVGLPAYLSPMPARLPAEELMLSRPGGRSQDVS